MLLSTKSLVSIINIVHIITVARIGNKIVIKNRNSGGELLTTTVLVAIMPHDDSVQGVAVRDGAKCDQQRAKPCLKTTGS